MGRQDSYYKIRYGITSAYKRKLFFTGQDGRCKLCETNLEFGFDTCYDKPSDSVVCKKCKLALSSIRNLASQFLEKALKMAKGEKVE